MQKHKVLVIDDSEDVHDLVRVWLAAEQIETLGSADGLTGLDLARRADLDLILLDVDMPGMDGFEVCRQLKADPATREVPVVFLSGAVEPGKKLLGLELGAVDYVGKPFDPAELRARVSGAIHTRQLMARLAESERFACSTVDALTTHIAILDGQGVIMATNRAWREFAVATVPDVAPISTGANYLDSCNRLPAWLNGYGPDVATGIRTVLHGGAPEFSIEYPWHTGAERRWFCVHVSRFPDGGPVRVVVARENITKRKAAEEQLRHASLHDALTGLPNRVLFSDRVDHCLARATRNPTARFAVLFLDLDRFKVINDSLGHAAGDHVLVTIAERLRRCVRHSDAVARFSEESTVARLGGDEFTILLEDLASPEDVALAAERIQAAVGQPFSFAGQEFSTSVSIGIVHGGPNYTTARDLLRDADVAMYRAKATGKSRFVIFDTTMHESAIARLRLENDLRRAIAQQEFELYYQPIVSLSSGEIAGFEALIRWRRGDTLISPADFIPIAEETGLIVPIGSWVLSAAAEQLARWRSSYPGRNLFLSVNLSRRQLSDASLILHVQDVLARSGLPADSIKLEITESAVMEDIDVSSSVLRKLKELGLDLCLDDFGTGLSSLSCLRKFPLDVLKIDRSFVSGSSEAGRFAILKAIIGLAENFGLAVVGEGVERPEQMEMLRSLKCEYAQGYLISKPMPVAIAEQLLAGPAPAYAQTA